MHKEIYSLVIKAQEPFETKGNKHTIFSQCLLSYELLVIQFLLLDLNLKMFSYLYFVYSVKF